ncbi:histidine phosphatase family protein [Streptomyces sp. NPDC002623]
MELFSSDLQRTRRTADAVAELFGVKPVLDRRLREKSYGEAPVISTPPNLADLNLPLRRPAALTDGGPTDGTQDLVPVLRSLDPCRKAGHQRHLPSGVPTTTRAGSRPGATAAYRSTDPSPVPRRVSAIVNYGPVSGSYGCTSSVLVRVPRQGAFAYVHPTVSGHVHNEKGV